MDDFSVYSSSFDHCLYNLASVLERCEETNLVLNFEKCHFMVEQGIILGHVISKNDISIDPTKIDIISCERGSIFSWTCRILQEVYQGLQQDSQPSLQLAAKGCII